MLDFQGVLAPTCCTKALKELKRSVEAAAFQQAVLKAELVLAP